MRITEFRRPCSASEPSAFSPWRCAPHPAMEFRLSDHASVVAGFDAQEIDGLSSILPPDIKSTAGATMSSCSPSNPATRTFC